MPESRGGKGTALPAGRFACDYAAQPRRFPMNGTLAWLIGIPIPIIIVLYLLDVF